MAERLAILGQAAPPTANAPSITYTVPNPGQAVVSCIVVANTTAAVARFRVFATNTAGTFTAATALFYDVTLNANASAVLNLGATLGPGAQVAVASSVAAALTFTVFGQEIV